MSKSNNGSLREDIGEIVVEGLFESHLVPGKDKPIRIEFPKEYVEKLERLFKAHSLQEQIKELELFQLDDSAYRKRRIKELEKERDSLK
jgi:hypothetical protein